MKKKNEQDLARIAKVMYDLQDYCSYEWDESEAIPCPQCPAGSKDVCNLFVPRHGIPKMWGITKADIMRLERGQ